jgi:SlyX protein
MNMEDAVEKRFAELEARIAFQEHAIAELSDALAAARAEEAGNALRLRRALEEIRDLRLALSTGPGGIDPANERPPHY